ncbi:DUF4184 family protein [Modestobacter sp. NPDC049651]|uniref:DUF4184 family protein n=1 Tax=unclassified Modestobacter TaxID=2643866 RepID=UPI003405AF79
MPFTLVHPAAVLPLARTPLVPSALAAGAMAPDLPYYVSLRWLGGDYNLTLTHSWTAVLWFDPLIALVLLAVFQLLLERPLLALLPPAAAGRAARAARSFTWHRIGWLLLSLVAGAATHLAWDALDDVAGYGWSSRLNLLSGVVGAVVLLVWAVRWWRTTAVEPVPAGLLLGRRVQAGVVAVAVVVALVAGAVGAVGEWQQVRDDGITGAADLAQYAARAFAIDAATALAVVMAVHALSWHLSRLGRAPRPA